MADDALKTVKRRAEDNAWFLLATLYGQPTIGIGDLELRLRNRRAWNRYMANAIHPDVLKKLVGEGKYSAEELNPSLASEIELAYSERHKQAGSAASTALPIEPWLAIDFSFDFSNLEFDELYLEGFLFPSRITFARASFSGTTNFRNVSFLAPAYFGGATFSDFAAFEHAIFYDYARFSGAIFSKGAYFEHTMFCADTLFDHVAFKQADFGRATFSNATFSKEADFSDAAFVERAEFHGTTFSGYTKFGRATFSKEADFFCATFSGDAEFHGTIFGRATRFAGVIVEAKIGFVNATMKGPASFELAKFKGQPPRFYGAQLHEGTVWRYVSWPIPRSWDDAGEYVDAYERLKLEMDRLKKHEDELQFFALELRSRRFLGRTPGISIAIYGLLCNYGRSYFLPLGWLLVTIVVGAALFLTHFGLSK